ncbi:MAG: MarR family transcriptional regulator [Bacilli bacterium]|nr:MarR family transcriptional regulator [Bacilli bacterium]MDD7315568.1 MarR family transcriptional regulator [Bacilli bacterium]
MDRDVLRESIEENINSIFKHKKFETFINFIEGEGSVLACLARNPEGIMPSKISKCINVSRARVTNILNTLCTKDYVELKPDPNDRRKVLAVLTEKGNNFVSEKINERVILFEYMYEYVGKEKMERFNELLINVLNMFNETEGGDCDE